jgi:hypothetical protein
MNERSLAISILQKARDTLSHRLTERVVEAQHEIQADAAGGSYLSEIETIYEQIGGRLAHLNAMLSNLPPADSAAPADATASEIIYADLASSYPAGLDLEATSGVTLLGLPAPARTEEAHARSLAGAFENIVLHIEGGDLAAASRLVAELFDIKPSQARRGAQAFARQMAHAPELAWRIEELGCSLDAANEYAAATLLGECFEFQAIEALSLVRALKTRSANPGAGD